MQLEAHPFFLNTRSLSFDKLKAAARVIEYAPQARIFDEGSPSDALYLLLDGEVAFTKRANGGKTHTVSVSKAGSFFGEIGIFTNAPRSLSAIAQNAVRIARIERRPLIEFMRDAPEHTEQILNSIVRHLHDTTEHYMHDMLRQEKMSLIGTMMNGILHDFKNPFTLISLSAQLIRERHPDAETARLCENIESQITRMVNMANEISEFSRGRQNLRFSPVNCEALLARFRELNAPFFSKEKLRIKMEADPLTIDAQADKLLRILQNLIGNAIDAVDERDEGRIEVAIRDKDPLAEITITDNGKGIPESIRESLFTPFVTHGKPHGTGLGTAIVKSIVEAHHGRIEVQTGANTGTRFVIQLPKKQPVGRTGF